MSVIIIDTGEILDYDRDKKLIHFHMRTRDCSDTCVHIGSHDWYWARDDVRWYG
jgi:hypothetical protein